MRRYLFACSLAGVFALAVSVAAQQYPPTQPPTPAPSAAQSQEATVTVEGCLMREADVPGRKPDVAERAGVTEDFILTSAKMVKGTAPAGAAQAKPGEPTGTSGSLSPMYDVKGLDADRLKPLVGKRVQIDGKFSDISRSPSAKPGEDLVNIQATTIRPATGECPPK